MPYKHIGNKGIDKCLYDIYHLNMSSRHIQTRIASFPLSQEQIALEAGYEPSLFSRILRGLRPEPADFARRVTAALDRLEQAEQAADRARQKVLGKGAVA